MSSAGRSVIDVGCRVRGGEGVGAGAGAGEAGCLSGVGSGGGCALTVSDGLGSWVGFKSI